MEVMILYFYWDEAEVQTVQVFRGEKRHSLGKDWLQCHDIYVINHLIWVTYLNKLLIDLFEKLAHPVISDKVEKM